MQVHEHRFQMHHYRDCAGDPLSRGFKPLSFAYLSLQQQREVGAAPHSNALNLSPKGLVYGAFDL